MSNYYIGEIRAFAFAYYPGDSDWLPCNGQTVAINQYTALYSLIGNTYGPATSTTFTLPNLNGIPMLGTGQGTGLSSYVLGQKTGQPTVTLTETQMPAHNHTVTGINATVANTYPTPIANTSHLSRAISAGKVDVAYSDQAAGATLATAALTPFVGSGQAHDNHQPNLALTFAIAVNGDYPIQP
jgi:microcystin-dependent protein